MLRNHLDKFVVMYRDLRDMAISRYFHVMNKKLHWHSKIYQAMSEEDGILHSINVVRREYVGWVKDWHEIALAHPDTIIEVRYEDLHANVQGTMGRVLSFLEVPSADGLLERMAATQLKKPVDLKESLARQDTRQKGIVGDWRNVFTQKHKDYFKKVAGPLLIELGYEKDLDC